MRKNIFLVYLFYKIQRELGNTYVEIEFIENKKKLNTYKKNIDVQVVRKITYKKILIALSGLEQTNWLFL